MLVSARGDAEEAELRVHRVEAAVRAKLELPTEVHPARAWQREQRAPVARVDAVRARARAAQLVQPQRVGAAGVEDVEQAAARVVGREGGGQQAALVDGDVGVGDQDLASQVGEGSTFTLVLPLD